MSSRLALVAALILGAAGCGGGSAPDGYATYELAEASVAHPRAWEVEVTNPGPVTKLAVAEPKGAQEGDVVPQVELRVTTLEEGDDFGALVDAAREGRDELLRDRDPKAKELDLEVDGAEDVRSAEVTYTGANGKPYRARSVNALSGDGRRIVSVTAGAPEGDPLDVDAAVASLELK